MRNSSLPATLLALRPVIPTRIAASRPQRFKKRNSALPAAYAVAEQATSLGRAPDDGRAVGLPANLL